MLNQYSTDFYNFLSNELPILKKIEANEWALTVHVYSKDIDGPIENFIAEANDNTKSQEAKDKYQNFKDEYIKELDKLIDFVRTRPKEGEPSDLKFDDDRIEQLANDIKTF